MNNSFTYHFLSSKSLHDVFRLLLDVRGWWSGVYDETITGKSERVDDEFNFRAGAGAHDTTQRLIEIIPDRKIVWEVTNSHLSFLAQPDEWTHTRICFELSELEDKTSITFTHEGLQPAIECYDTCSNAWMLYLKRLEDRLK